MNDPAREDVVTPAQQAFLGRSAVLDWIEEVGARAPSGRHWIFGEVLADHEDRGGKVDDAFLEALVETYGFPRWLIHGWWLAFSDWEKSRDVMEEGAAYSLLMAEIGAKSPGLTKRAIQKLVRAEVADPAVRLSAVTRSNLYATINPLRAETQEALEEAFDV